MTIDVISPLQSGYSVVPDRQGCAPLARVCLLDSADSQAVSADEAPRWMALLGISASSRNQGVQALGASLVSLCTGAAPGVGIRLLIGSSTAGTVRYRCRDKEHCVPVVNFRMSPKSALCDHLAWIVFATVMYRVLPFSATRAFLSRRTPWIRALEQCAFAGDVRGGDSFSDIYGMRRFMIGFLAVWTVLLMKRPLVQLPQTYGPFKNPMARRLARFLLRRSTVIMARDKASYQIARELAGPSPEIMLSPDAAFSLESLRPQSPQLDPPLDGPMADGMIGINVNGLMYHGGYTRDNMFGLKLDYPGFLRKLLAALLEEQKQDVLLVPHTYAPAGDVESDPAASRQLRDSLPPHLRKRVRIVAAEYDAHEVKGMIGLCDFFIGSRMHSCIAALSQGIPCVGVAYSRKFHGVFESVGMESWVVDARMAGEQEALERVICLYRDRDPARKSLQLAAADARLRLTDVFQRMMARPELQTSGSAPSAPQCRTMAADGLLERL